MASAKQIEANRENAQKSTGPKTIEGKNVSKFNALVHGLAAQSPALPHESADDYELTRSRLHEDFQPAGVYEEMLVDQLAMAHWRLVRSGRVETVMAEIYILNAKKFFDKDMAPGPQDDKALGLYYARANEKELANCLRYYTHAERAFHRAGDALAKAQAARRRREREEARAKAEFKADAPTATTARAPKMGSFRTTNISEFPAPPQHFTAPVVIEDPHR